MVEDLPAAGGELPDGGAAGLAVGLVEGVGDEVGVGIFQAEAAALVVEELPAGGCCVYGWVSCEVVEDEGSGVAAAGGSDLPVIGVGHAGEVFGSGGELRTVEDGLAGGELGEDGVEFGFGRVGGW